ncbi:MAG: CoA pyrophosphatase, partial [Myxococcota bacterium]
GTHKGHVAFPGGHLEEQDATLRDTALRETWEEIALPPQHVHVLGEMDDFPAIHGDLRVSPWVGQLTHVPALRPNPTEVARIFEVPLEAMSQRDRWRTEMMQRGQYTWPVYFFDVDGEVVWGLTAYIILKLSSHSPWGSPFEIRTDQF